MFDHFDTAFLTQARKNLIHPIPGDGTFLATAGALLRSIVDAELDNPDRIQRDKDAAAAAQKAADEAAAAKVKEAEGAAGGAPTASPVAQSPL